MKNCLLCMVIILIAMLSSCSEDQEGFLSSNSDPLVSENLERVRECGTADHQNTLLQNLEYRRGYEQRLRNAESRIATRSSADCDEPVILPVAVHFRSARNVDLNCLKTLVDRQIEILNEDFAAANNDVTLWNQVSNLFPGVSPTSACVQFCLATKNHPAGTNLSDGDPAITVNQVSQDFSAKWAKYLNIFVAPNSGILGEAPLGGAGNAD